MIYIDASHPQKIWYIQETNVGLNPPSCNASRYLAFWVGFRNAETYIEDKQQCRSTRLHHTSLSYNMNKTSLVEVAPCLTHLEIHEANICFDSSAMWAHSIWVGFGHEGTYTQNKQQNAATLGCTTQAYPQTWSSLVEVAPLCDPPWNNLVGMDQYHWNDMTLGISCKAWLRLCSRCRSL